MKILLIDDSQMQHKIAAIYLEKGGEHKLLHADNGAEGIQKAREEAPDVILLDMEMPEMNGEEALRVIKNDPALRDIPVLICTANDEEMAAHKMKGLGASGFMKKPHGFKGLCNEIKLLSKTA